MTNKAPRTRPLSNLTIVAAVIALVCLLSAAWITRHWPFVGDATLLRYSVLLMQHGFAPYRQIIDINLPGGYLYDWVVSHVFGSGAAAWRWFDFSLCGAAGGAMLLLAGSTHRWAALLAACAFAVIHMQDGVAESGQRDLVMAVLLLFSCACLQHIARRQTILYLLSGFFAAFAVTIKPTAAAALLLPIGYAAIREQPSAVRVRFVIAAFAGELLPLLGVLFFLLHFHALRSFWTLTLAMLRLHASLQNRPLLFLLVHSYAPLLPLLLVWLPIAARARWRGRRLLLSLYALAGLLSYVLQHKGHVYQRYPFVAFLLLLVCIDFDAALQASKTFRVLAAAGLLLLGGFIVPQSVWLLRGYDWYNQEFITDLQADLQNLGGVSSLNGSVQCLDMVAGCINTLQRMQIVQSTGFLYDCYLLEPGTDPTMLRLRESFLTEMVERPPQVIVESNQFCLGNPPDFAKMKRWPALQQLISSRYEQVVERHPTHIVHWWKRPEAPLAYRIFRLKAEAAPVAAPPGL